jgi:tetratricopeptide (TPR) repeat protein
MRIEFGILGETFARLGERQIDLGPTRQRSVLAVLLAEANAIVSVEQLADRVWGDVPPHTAAKTLRSYLSRLRTALSGAAECAIRSRRGGYVLEVDEAAVDVHLFRRLVGQARAGSGDDAAASLYERALQWYVHTAANARAQLAATPHRLPVAPHPPESITPERFGSHQAAVEWFDAEQDAIVKIVQSAGEHGHHLDGAVLAQLIWPYFYLRGLWQQMRVVGEVGVEYAIAVGNPLLEAKIRNGLSAPYGYLPGFTEVEAATCERALSIFARLGDRRGQADSLLNLGSTYHNAQRFAEARDALERAQDLYLQDGNQLYAAFALNNLAGAFRGLDRLDDALHCAHRAVGVIRGSSEPFRLVSALVTLAEVHAARGDHNAAIRCYREAISTAECLENTYHVVPLRIWLGQELSAAGAEQDAVDVWREAYKICLAQEHPSAEEIERLLTSATERTNGTLAQPAGVR